MPCLSTHFLPLSRATWQMGSPESESEVSVAPYPPLVSLRTMRKCSPNHETLLGRDVVVPLIEDGLDCALRHVNIVGRARARRSRDRSPLLATYLPDGVGHAAHYGFGGDVVGEVGEEGQRIRAGPPLHMRGGLAGDVRPVDATTRVPRDRGGSLAASSSETSISLHHTAKPSVTPSAPSAGCGVRRTTYGTSDPPRHSAAGRTLAPANQRRPPTFGHPLLVPDPSPVPPPAVAPGRPVPRVGAFAPRTRRAPARRAPTDPRRSLLAGSASS